MLEFYKEKIKANIELLKIIASGVTVCAIIAGNIATKDNFGVNASHYIVFTFLTLLIIIGKSIVFKFYFRINFYLNKIEDNERIH